MSSIGPVVSEEKMFENVDGWTDAGVTGILLAHPWAFVSGELINIHVVELSLTADLQSWTTICDAGLVGLLFFEGGYNSFVW